MKANITSSTLRIRVHVTSCVSITQLLHRGNAHFLSIVSTMTQMGLALAVMVVMTISITHARQLLGDKACLFSDAEIQTKIDSMIVIANRVYDVLEHKNITQPRYERNIKPQT